MKQCLYNKLVYLSVNKIQSFNSFLAFISNKTKTVLEENKRKSFDINSMGTIRKTYQYSSIGILL